MQIELPLTVTSALTLVGAAAFAAIAGQWLKTYLAEWRFTGLVVLALSLAFTFTAQLIASDWRPDGSALFSAFLIGFGGASLGTYGYELIVNLLGIVGVGPRSEKVLQKQALARCEKIMTPRPQPRG